MKSKNFKSYFKKRIDTDMAEFRRIMLTSKDKNEIEITDKLFLIDCKKSLQFLQKNIESVYFDMFYDKYILEKTMDNIAYKYIGLIEMAFMIRNISKAICKIAVFRYTETYILSFLL